MFSIDALFVVHMDKKSHTRYCLTLGTGSSISGLLGQKVNTRSSTESELVRGDDIIGYVEWTSLYCKDQVKEYLSVTMKILRQIPTRIYVLQ